MNIQIYIEKLQAVAKQHPDLEVVNYCTVTEEFEEPDDPTPENFVGVRTKGLEYGEGEFDSIVQADVFDHDDPETYPADVFTVLVAKEA